MYAENSNVKYQDLPATLHEERDKAEPTPIATFILPSLLFMLFRSISIYHRIQCMFTLTFLQTPWPFMLH